MHWEKFFGEYYLLVQNLLTVSILLGDKMYENFFANTIVKNLPPFSTFFVGTSISYVYDP